MVPAPDDGDLVRHLEHLVELVRDEQDREALGLQLAQRVEQLVDLLRDEHSGRLVEDQGAGAAVEHLEDLDALALADAQVLDQLVGAHVEAVAVGDLEDAGTGEVVVEAHTALGLAAEDDVLEHRQVVRELEVLVHHAHTAGDRLAGAGEHDGLAVEGDRAAVGPVHAVQRLHQRGFAGAVLAHDRVDGAATDTQVDVLVGHDTGERLGDVPQLDREHFGRRGGVRLGADGCSLLARVSGRDRPTVGTTPGPIRTLHARIGPGPVIVQRVLRHAARPAVTYYYEDGTVMVPAMIWSLSSLALATYSATAALDSEKPTPSAFRSKVWTPVSGVPPTAALIVS